MWKDSYLPDGECSVKSIWGTRIRLEASPSRDKILCRCITNGGDGGTAGNALARGYAPAWSVGLFLFRLGRPPPSFAMSPCAVALTALCTHALERRCFIIGEWGAGSTGVLLADMTEIRHLTHVMQSLPSMSVVAYQGKLRCHFPSMDARIRAVSHDRSIAMRMKLTARPARAISAGPPLLAPAHNTL